MTTTLPHTNGHQRLHTNGQAHIMEAQGPSTSPVDERRQVRQFGRIPGSIIGDGRLAAMKPGAAKVLLALAAHADANYLARPGQRRLAEVSGLPVGSVNNYIRHLREIGVIEVEGHAKNGAMKRYRILDRSRQDERSTVRASANGTLPDRSRQDERSTVHDDMNGFDDRSRPEPQTVRAGAPDRSRLARTKQKDRENEEQKQKSDCSNAANAADRAAGGECFQLLIAAGMPEPSARHFASQPNVTKAMVQEVIDACDGYKNEIENPGAYLIEALRNAIDADCQTRSNEKFIRDLNARIRGIEDFMRRNRMVTQELEDALPGRVAAHDVFKDDDLLHEVARRMAIARVADMMLAKAKVTPSRPFRAAWRDWVQHIDELRDGDIHAGALVRDLSKLQSLSDHAAAADLIDLSINLGLDVIVLSLDQEVAYT